MKHGRHAQKLVTKRDAVLIAITALATLAASVAADLVVMVLEHSLY